MARSAPLPKGSDKSEEAADKLHGIFERRLAKLSPKERARRWTALEQYVRKVSPDGGTPSKP
jgi:hypothetical protein